MAYYSGVPYVRYAEAFNPAQRRCVEEAHLAAPVFSQCSVLFTCSGAVAEEPGEHLVYYYLIVHGYI